MEKNSTSNAAPLFSGEVWFDPIEAELRQRIRGFLEEMVEQEDRCPGTRPLPARCSGRLPEWHALTAAAGLVWIGRDCGSPGPAVGP